MVTVPSFTCLWSSEDIVAGHFRRYRINELLDMLVKSGFKIEYKNYFMSFLFVPILFVRVGLERIGIIKRAENRTKEEKRKFEESQFKTNNRIVHSILSCFESIEQRILKKSGRVLFGSSIIIVARKL